MVVGVVLLAIPVVVLLFIFGGRLAFNIGGAADREAQGDRARRLPLRPLGAPVSRRQHSVLAIGGVLAAICWLRPGLLTCHWVTRCRGEMTVDSNRSRPVSPAPPRLSPGRWRPH